MCGHPRCPWGIGKHPATLADARDEITVRRALLETGTIPLAEAEQRYAAWKTTWERAEGKEAK